MSRISEPRHPAYHLRPNKAIDRFIFIELVRVLQIIFNLKKYTYIGMGGPFIEDYKLFSQQFPYMKLISVENDQETFKRQVFHKCSRNMVCKYQSLAEFIASDFPSENPVIVWADYTDVTRECFAELADMIRKVVPSSLIKITVRAETPVSEFKYKKYPERIPATFLDKFERIQKKYSTDFTIDGNKYPLSWFEWKNFSKTEYPKILSRMIISVMRGACTSPKEIIPLHSVMYSDGTMMLSVTGLVLSSNDSHFQDRIKILREHFQYYIINPDEVEEIDIPCLTTKERLFLEDLLPDNTSHGKKTIEKLGYLIEGDGTEELSNRKMKQFERYNRLYPFFGKILP